MATVPQNITKIGDAVIPHRVVLDFTLVGTTPATAANWGCACFIADEFYELVSVTERHTTAGSDGGAVTAMLKRAASGTALSAGTDMLASGMSMKSTANTNSSGTLHATAANRRISPGQAIGFVLTGTPTAVAGAHFTVELKRIVAF